MKMPTCAAATIFFLTWSAAVHGAEDEEVSAGARAEHIIRSTGVRAGFCVHLGTSDGDLSAELGRGGRFLVQGLAADATGVEKARAFVCEQGIYGQVSVDRCDFKRLPYADSLVNLLVADELPALLALGLRLQEVQRVLAPTGAAWLGAAQGLTRKALEGILANSGLDPGRIEIVEERGVWALVRGTLPDGVDEWTHNCYGPGGNLLSKDVVAGPPQRLRWIAGVPWQMPDYSAKAMVVGGGRMFYVLNEMPPLAGESGTASRNWRYLTARDAFSGVQLWKERWTAATGSYGVLSMVVSGDRLYMPLDGKLVAREAATGKTIKTYDRAGADPASVLLCKDYLLVVGGAASKYQLRCLDAESGELRWSNDHISLEPFWGLPGYAVHDGKVYYKESKKPSLGCLDLATGSEQWHVDLSAVMGLDRDKGSTLCSHGEGTLIVGVYGGKTGIYAFSDLDGKSLWSYTYMRIGGLVREKAKTYMGGFFIDGLYWIHVGDYVGYEGGDPGDVSKKEAGKLKRRFSWQGLDPATGKVKRRFDYPEDVRVWASCFRDQATERFFMGGYSVFVDTETGAHHPRSEGLHTSCRIGARPAYGLIYNSALYYPHTYLQGDMAVESGNTVPDDEPRLEKGPAFGLPPRDREDADAWPCPRHDPLRTNRTAAELPAACQPLWETHVGGRLSQPVVSAGLVFVAAIDRHAVVALDAESGEERWRFVAGGRVPVAPTVYKGFCLFGSSDGWVYGLDAATGRMVWRFRAARSARRIVAHEGVESAWPVQTGVVVVNDRAFFGAGRHGQVDGGIDVYAVDVFTGKEIWRNVATENAPTSLMVSDGQVVSVQSGKSSFDLGQGKAASQLRLVPAGACSATHLDPAYVVLGPQQPESGKQGRQSARVNVTVEALIRAGKTVLVAGRKDPGASGDAVFTLTNEGRPPADAADFPMVHPAEQAEPVPHALWVFPAAGGKSLGAIELPVQPVFDGMAVAAGRLFIAFKDGRLCGFGEEVDDAKNKVTRE